MIYLLSLHLYVSLEADWFFSNITVTSFKCFNGILYVDNSFPVFKKPYVSSFSTVFIVLNGAIVL